MSARTRRRSSSPVKADPRPPAQRWVVYVLLLALGGGLWAWTQHARPAQAHLRRGQEFAAAHQDALAEQEWRQGVTADPAAPNCHAALGDLYARQERFPDAVTEYAAAAKLSPNDGALFLRLSQALVRVNDLPAAGDAARRAADLRPDDPAPIGLYGIIESKRKQNDKAILALRRALQLAPDTREFLLPLVQLEVGSNDYAGAERDLTPYAQAHTTDADACYQMALILRQKPHTPDNQKAALDYARRAQAAMPGNESVLILLGRLSLDAHQPAQALQIYQSVVKAHPNSEEALQGLVTCYTQSGDSGKAGAAAGRLAEALTRHNRMAHLTDQIRLNQQDIGAALEMARLEEQDGDNRMAEAFYDQAIRLAPADPRPRPALAAFLRRTGRPELAKQATRTDFLP